jgi:hypothetical protein
VLGLGEALRGNLGALLRHDHTNLGRLGFDQGFQSPTYIAATIWDTKTPN